MDLVSLCVWLLGIDFLFSSQLYHDANAFIFHALRNNANIFYSAFFFVMIHKFVIVILDLNVLVVNLN